jgi:hypothetical protein
MNYERLAARAAMIEGKAKELHRIASRMAAIEAKDNSGKTLTLREYETANFNGDDIIRSLVSQMRTNMPELS